jgi:hypothetical protein
MKKIVDCFPFFNETELLELRIRMLEPFVDLFVISEANRTHSGLPKEYNLKRIITELNLPAEKIKVLEVDLYANEAQTSSYIDFCHATSARSEEDSISWTRERLQRDAVSKIVDEFDDDTVFIMSDCDEIIDPLAIDYLVNIARNNPKTVVRVPLRLLESRADLEVTDIDGNSVSWDESMFLCMKHHIKTTDITVLKANRVANEFSPWNGLFATHNGCRIENLGWHFTWMGDQQRKLYKSQAFIHHRNLNVINNISQDTIEFLSNHLAKDISTEKKYKLRKIDHSVLPKKIFELPRVKDFLLGEEQIKETQMKERHIVNCFTYTGEKELLDFRIKLLKDYVDLFIIAEGDHTYSGMSKSYSCKTILDELGIPTDNIKIVEVKLPNLAEEPDSKVRERLLRDSFKDHVSADSLCYVTDSDEILDPEYIDYYTGVLKSNPGPVLRLLMAHLSGRADRIIVDTAGVEKQHAGPYLCMGKLLKDHRPSDIRNPKYGSVFNVYLRDNNVIENAGWKFEWMGSKEQRKDSYRSSIAYAAHSTLGRRVRLEFIDGYQPLVGGVDAMSTQGTSLKEYPIDNLPQLLHNTPKFQEFFLPQISEPKVAQEPLKFDHTHLPLLKFNKTPLNSVFLVDNFYEDPYAVREFAMNQEFEHNPDHYGYVGRRTIRQYFPPGIKERFEEIIGEPISNWEGHGYNGRFQFNVAGQPLVYHCDEQKWAGLIYLTPNAPYQAGTRLLAHKKNRVRWNGEQGIMDCFSQETFLDGTPFETVDHVGNVFNRLVIYRGGMIHAASEYFGHNMETGRLWHMFFFD